MRLLRGIIASVARHDELYQRAAYYDIVFDRDVRKGIAFVQAAYRHYAGGEPSSVLDVACGPGYHARAFARLGLRVVGLDFSPDMIDYARDRAVAEGLTIQWLCMDMRSFKLARPVDVAVCMFDSIDALLTNADVVEHFESVARNLNPGGLYVIERVHPRDFPYHGYDVTTFRGERDGVAVELRWGTNSPRRDPVTGIARAELELRVTENGADQVVYDTADERLLIPQEINLLAQLSGALEVVGWHGDYDLAQPLDASTASPWILGVLRKPA